MSFIQKFGIQKYKIQKVWINISAVRPKYTTELYGLYGNSEIIFSNYTFENALIRPWEIFSNSVTHNFYVGVYIVEMESKKT